MNIKNLVYLILITLILFSSCSEGTDIISDAVSTETLSDASLISEIDQDVNLTEVEFQLLPSSVQFVLNRDVADNFVNYAKKSKDFGFKIGLRSKNPELMDQVTHLYFSREGRTLKSDDRSGDGVKGDEESKSTCIALHYPVSYNMPDGSTISGNNKEEVIDKMKSWYEANPSSVERPTLQFPRTVSFGDQTVTVANVGELERLSSECDTRLSGPLSGDVEESSDPKEDNNYGALAFCIELVYPVSYIMSDGSKVSGKDKEDMKIALNKWFSANPGVQAKPGIQYPVTIVFRNEKYTVENDEEMRRFEEACDRDGGDRDDGQGDDGPADDTGGGDLDDRDGGGD